MEKCIRCEVNVGIDNGIWTKLGKFICTLCFFFDYVENSI